MTALLTGGSWRVFERQPQRGAPGAVESVGINGPGRITISRRLHLIWGEPEWVVVLVDVAERLIGFRPAAATEAHVWRVAGKANGARAISCREALRLWYGDGAKGPMRVPARIEDGMLVIGPLPEREAKA